jgi:1,4-dihydroxy-2-naphthoate polyprenyltransferase
MKKWIKITALLALVSGISLILISNLLWWEKLLIFILGLAALWAANNYTRGDVAYGYKAYGDVFVFIFFGLVGVMGSLFLSIHKLNNAAILPAIGVGALSVAVLHLNNMRDFVNDKASNKITIAIKLGFENSKIYFLVLIISAIVSWGSYVLTQNAVNYFSYIYWLGFIPLIFVLLKFFKIKELKDYDILLKPTALTCFAISILFFISQIF